MYRHMLFVFLLISACTARTETSDNILRWDVKQDLDPVYVMVYRALEKHKFFVIFEPNIGRNLTGFAARWGEDYNRNQLDQIRAMVICNIWYTNQIANKDPDMLSLCPLTVTLFEKDGSSTVLFPRPTALAGESPARPVLQEVEDKIIAAIREGLE